MKRGDFFRVTRLAGDPKKYRVVILVSRQSLIDSRFSMVVCAPVYTRGDGLATQVPVGTAEGLKHSSWIMCDNLVSVHKSELTYFVGSLSQGRFAELDYALRTALSL